MYNHTRSINFPAHFSDGSDVKPATALPVEPIGHSPEISYEEAQAFGDCNSIGGFEADASPTDAAAAYDGVAQCGNAGDQLTLSFAGQVYVFDAVTAEKVMVFISVFPN